MYDSGVGVLQDKFKAVEFYQKACEGGYGVGCTNLGVMYANGEGVRQDKSKALEFYGNACNLKNEAGCKNYANLKNQGLR
jgi:TPR repeat protein